MEVKMTKEEVLKIVDNSFSKGKNIDIISMATTLGINVYSEPMSNDKSAFLRKEDDTFTITVNENHKMERQRFSVAHEIAHFILHNDLIENNTCVGRESNAISLDLEKEEEADNFAAEMLMPQKYVEEYLSKNNIHKNMFIFDDAIVKDLANKFNVSFFASIVRMRDLGYKVAYL